MSPDIFQTPATPLVDTVASSLAPGQVSAGDLNAHFLQLELQRINLLILKHFLGQNNMNEGLPEGFRGLAVDREEVFQTLAKIDQSDFSPSLDQNLLNDLRDRSEVLLEEAAQLCANGFQPNLYRLIETCQLSSAEYHAFLICLSSAFNLGFEKVFGYLNNDVTRRYPSRDLIIQVLRTGEGDQQELWQALLPESKLLREGLILAVSEEETPVELKTMFVAAPELVNWLAGKYQPAKQLANAVSISAADGIDLMLVEPEIAKYDPAVVAQHKPLVILSGPDEAIVVSSAKALIRALGEIVFEIDLEVLKTVDCLNALTLSRLLRDARLNQAVPLLRKGELALATEEPQTKALFSALLSFPETTIICTAVHPQPILTNAWPTKPVFRWNLLMPDSPRRLKIWQNLLTVGGKISAEELTFVADQFVLTSAQIHQAWYLARDAALQLTRPLQMGDLYEAARQCSSHQLDQLAVKVEPRFGWDDIILPEDEIAALHEIVSMVRDRTLVLETWGLGRKLVSSKGVSSLFAGEPGTGKTLAAQVIAKELGMDLYKIDLSTVVSKYIGETEKNLELIFTQARNSNAILFFDEADAIFGKRSEVKDAHDRYANIEVGYLLQRMESYDGIVILATNLHSNMDEAFTRRLQFVVDFPFPDQSQREAIWKVLFPAEAPCAEQINFHYFAEHFRLAGGNIRNVIVYAAFLAASEHKPISHKYLIHGIRRELRKMGRLIDEKEFEVFEKGRK